MLRFAKDLEDLDEPNSIWYRNNNDRLSLQNDSKRMLIREHLEEFLFGRSYKLTYERQRNRHLKAPSNAQSIQSYWKKVFAVFWGSQTDVRSVPQF